MKILHIDTEMTWRGGENQMRLLIEGMNRKGIKSHLAAQPGSVAAEKLSGTACVFTTRMRGGVDMMAARRIARYCRNEGIDIIDAQTGNAHSLGILIKKILPSLKLVVHRRVDNPPKNNFFSKKKYQSKLVDQYIAISLKIKSVLIESGIPETKIETVYSAIDPTPYQTINRKEAQEALKERFKVPSQQHIIGNASAFSTQKGHETLLHAIKHLVDAGSNSFHVLLAGTGENKEEMQALSERLQISKFVTFVGWVENVPAFISGLDVLAMPSNNEGLGTLIQEAIHAGTPVCATSVGGIPEMIEHGSTGLLCKKGAFKALAEHIQQILDDPELAKQLSEEAKCKLNRHFSLSQMVAGNLNIYRSLF